MGCRSPYCVLIVGGLLAFAIWAQDNPAVFHADVRLVVLHATVVDNKGRFLTNLPQGAFQVFENGIPQALSVFRREDTPVSMGIVIDNSGSMRNKTRKVAAAAVGLLKASNPSDEVFIVNFSDEAYLDVDFTSDLAKLEAGLSKIGSRGGTAMRDSIRLSLGHLSAEGRRDKKILIVITDGNDNASEITQEDLLQEAQTHEVVAYAIALLNEEGPFEARRAKRALNALTAATGGQAFYPERVRDLTGFALRVARDIRNQYTLAYTPAQQGLDGSFRQIRVTAAGRGKPAVRTRRGYYATPELARQSKLAAAANASREDH